MAFACCSSLRWLLCLSSGTDVKKRKARVKSYIELMYGWTGRDCKVTTYVRLFSGNGLAGVRFTTESGVADWYYNKCR